MKDDMRPLDLTPSEKWKELRKFLCDGYMNPRLQSFIEAIDKKLLKETEKK